MLVTRADGSLWVRVLDLALLGLEPGAVRSSSHAGEAIVQLDQLPTDLVVDPIGGRAHFIAPDAPHLPDPGGAELLLDVVINLQPLREPQLVHYRDGELFLSGATLAAVGAAGSDAAADGWTSVHALAGEHFVLDPQEMRLELTLPPQRFATTRVGVSPASAVQPLSRAVPAAILAYDASVARDAEGVLRQSVLADATVSAGRGHCRSRHLWRSSGEGTQRLDTSCTLDWPERLLSLNVGDGLTRQALLSAPVRYGGVRLGTDYGLQPYLYTQPLLDVGGEARLPSVLEVWVEQQLALQTELPPGPFTLDSIPLLSGRGDVQAVLVDALGRRTVVSAPFYSDPSLLRRGFSDWSLEAGRPRRGWLSPDDSYGGAFALGSWRRGLTDWLTVEGRAEWRDAGSVLGVGATASLAGMGVAELGLARSQHGAVSGGALVAGYSYRGTRWNLGLRGVRRDRHYADLAWPSPGEAPRTELQAGVGVRVGKASISVSAAARETPTGDQRVATAAASVPLAAGYLSLSATHVIQPAGDTQLNAIYTLPLSQRDTMSARIAHGAQGTHPGLGVQRSAPAGPGVGWRADLQDTSTGTSVAADAVLRGRYGSADASLLHHDGDTSARVGASGAVVATSDGVFATIDEGGSFAVVSVPAPQARVLQENQVATVTNASGRALVGRMRPFERNRIGLDTRDLPLDTRVGNSDLELVPGRRHVVRADFEVAAVRYLSAVLRLADGRFVPVGATAHIGEASFPIGNDGLLFAELPAAPGAILIRWAGDPLCTIPVARLPQVPDSSITHQIACDGAPHEPD